MFSLPYKKPCPNKTTKSVVAPNRFNQSPDSLILPLHLPSFWDRFPGSLKSHPLFTLETTGGRSVSVLGAMDAGVRPDTSTHVTRSSGKVASSRAGRDGDDRVLVTLEHQLGVAGAWVPELDSTVLRARHDPLSIRGQGNTENEVLWPN